MRPNKHGVWGGGAAIATDGAIADKWMVIRMVMNVLVNIVAVSRQHVLIWMDVTERGVGGLRLRW